MQNNKKKRKAKKSRKPKVYIPPYKIIILCSIVIVICMSLLLVTTIKSSENPQNSSIQNRYQQTEVTQKENSSDKKKDVPAKAEEKSKEENVKKAKSGKTDNQKKTDDSKDKSESKKQDKQSAAKTETSKSQKNETKKADKSENSVSTMTEVPAENKPETTQTTQTKKSSGAESQNLEKKENQSSAKDENKKTQEDKNQKVQETSKSQKSQSQKKSESLEPVETQKNERKTNKFDFPLAKNHAQLIFVFDDGGQNLAHLESFLKLPIPITIAVLPRLVHSVESAQKIRNSGNELILHQPMQALNSKVNPGPGAITPQMSEDEIIATLFYNINEIGPIAGMNNHEGSAITADAEKMAVILKMANEEGIYFLDSRTNSETKVPYVANLMGYSYYERNIFLDNEKTNENALQELKKGLAIANKNGSVIMIGHIWSASFLPDFLLEVIPELQEKGYTFCTVSTSNAQKF